jgi:hypothetical protein
MGEVGPVDSFRHTLPHSFSTGEPSETSDPGGPIDTFTTGGYTNPGGIFSSVSDPNASSTPTDSSTFPTDTDTTSSTPPPTSDSSSSSMTTPAPSTSSTGVPANSGSGNGSDPSPISTITKHGLSGGSTAGLVIGLLALLGILGALFYLWRRRRAARGGANGNFLSFGGSPLSGGGGGASDGYTEQKPRSRPASRYVVPPASSTPFVPTATDLLPRHHHTSTQSVGTVVSDMARTHESHGTLAGVDDSDYLEKLEDAEANIGTSVTSGTTLTHGDSPFLTYDAPAVPNRPSPSKARDTKNRRSTGDAMVIVDHNYGRYDTEAQPAIPRPRSKSQDLARGGDVTPPSPTTYPPVPTSQPTSPVSAGPLPPPRKTPRKKPVPRYSEEASRSPTSRRDNSSSPPATGLPAEFEGKPVHYLIPDMPAPQR